MTGRQLVFAGLCGWAALTTLALLLVRLEAPRWALDATLIVDFAISIPAFWFGGLLFRRGR